MRLGQLARKLSISTSEISDFLATKNIQVETGSNSRLENENAKLVVEHFAPTLLDQLFVEEESVPAEIVQEEFVAEASVPTESLLESESITDEASASEPLPDIIKAPKIELPGLKVIGKIDLPEPKKKSPSPEAEQPGERQEERPSRNSAKRLPKRNETPRTWKNPIEAQREKEAAERERLKKEKASKEKEKRTQNYLKKVKSVPTKPARRLEDQVIEMTSEPEQPKTWLGKLKRWFTT